VSRVATLLRAFVYLQATTVFNLIRQRLRRLRQPRYLIGAIAGIAYFYLAYSSHRWGDQVHGDASAVKRWMMDPAWHGLLVDAIGAVLLTVTLLAWLLPNGRAALRFTEAEIAFLFPAPLTRRTLIHYRLLRMQFGILLTALVMSFIARSAGGSDAHPLLHAVGWWVMLSTLRLHFLAASFGREWLLDLGMRVWLRRALAATIAIALFGGSLWWMSQQTAPPIVAGFADLPRFLHYVAALLATPPLSSALTPFTWLVAPMFATDASMFLSALPLALGLMAVHYVWVLRFDAAFEEASMEAAQRRAAHAAAWRSGRGGSWRQAPQKPRTTPFALAPTGFAPSAFLWKGLIALGGFYRLRTWLIACGISIACLTWFAANPHTRQALTAIGGAALSLSVWLFVLGPMFAQQSLRRMFEHLDVLKASPLLGRQLVLGELMTPVVVITAAQWLLLLVGGLSLQPWTEDGMFSTGSFVVMLIAAAALSPVLCGLMLCVPFAGMLLFPAWLVGPPGESRGGIEIMGQRLIFLAGYVLVLLLALLPAGLSSALAFFAAQWLGGSNAVSLALAVVVAMALLTAEWLLVIVWLGRRVDGLDLSLERFN
jgi:ABC-2 type transport system permease protein